MNVITLLNAVTGTGAGSTVEPVLDADSQYQNLPVQIYGTFVGTVQTQVSLDGTNWFTYASDTAPDAFTIPYFPYVRANVSAYTSGTINAKIGY